MKKLKYAILMLIYPLAIIAGIIWAIMGFVFISFEWLIESEDIDCSIETTKKCFDRSFLYPRFIYRKLFKKTK